MADLADLKVINDELVPLFKDLFSLARMNGDKENRSGESAVIKRLRKLNSQADQTTSASLNERLGAMVASHTTLTEILIEAAVSGSVINPAKMHAVRVRRRSLDDAIGDLLILEAFRPISKLLDSDTIAEIEDTLKKANKDIDTRRQAKAVLDTMIGVAMTGAKIATKLATL